MTPRMNTNALVDELARSIVADDRVLSATERQLLTDIVRRLRVNAGDRASRHAAQRIESAIGDAIIARIGSSVKASVLTRIFGAAEEFPPFAPLFPPGPIAPDDPIPIPPAPDFLPPPPGNPFDNPPGPINPPHPPNEPPPPAPDPAPGPGDPGDPGPGDPGEPDGPPPGPEDLGLRRTEMTLLAEAIAVLARVSSSLTALLARVGRR